MAESKPGFTTLKETEHIQLFGSGPDQNHQRFSAKGDIKSTSVDAGNTPTTTLRGGLVMALKDSDGMCYPYDADATDGTQKVVGLLDHYLSMFDKDFAVEDKFTHIAKGGLIKDVNDLKLADKSVLAVLLRIGFHMMSLEAHGSAFGFHPKARYFKTADYTLLDGDHGNMYVAAGAGALTFTMPTLATVGKGYQVLLFNSVNQDMIVTAAANTIVYGDAAGALSTSLTFNTVNKKMGGQVLMYADYISDGGALGWYPLFLPTTVVSA